METISPVAHETSSSSYIDRLIVKHVLSPYVRCFACLMTLLLTDDVIWFPGGRTLYLSCTVSSSSLRNSSFDCGVGSPSRYPGAPDVTSLTADVNILALLVFLFSGNLTDMKRLATAILE